MDGDGQLDPLGKIKTMKKIILSILFSISALLTFAVGTPNTANLHLQSGSVTIYAGSTTQVFLTKDTLTLSSDMSIIFSGTPLIGSQFTIWFNGTNIHPNGHSIFILSQEYTKICSGVVNLFVTCTYNGTAWTVTSPPANIASILANYPDNTDLSDTLLNYVSQSQLTNTVDTLEGTNSGNFTKLRAPTLLLSTNTTEVVTTALLTTARALLAPLASPALTGAPTAPTQSLGDNTTKISNDNFVQNALAAYQPSIILSNQAINPTASFGAGAGTGAVATITGNAVGFRVNLTTGTGCSTSSNILTVAFTSSYPAIPLAFIQSRNVNSTSAAFYLITPAEATTGIAFTSGGTALADATQYIFNVIVIGQ